MKKHTGKIWRGLATTTASLLTITLGGSSIANARVDFINATLGTSSYKNSWLLKFLQKVPFYSKIQIRPFHLTNPKKLLPSGA